MVVECNTSCELKLFMVSRLKKAAVELLAVYDESVTENILT